MFKATTRTDYTREDALDEGWDFIRREMLICYFIYEASLRFL